MAALAGDPSRANMLSALAGGKALTASELANEAGVTLQTASSHLSQLETGGLVASLKQGRHRYFRLAERDVAAMLEAMMGVAARAGQMRTRTGPADPALRRARVCYDHLAGEMGVQMLDSLLGAGRIARTGDGLRLARRGADFLAGLGVDTDAGSSRRLLCRPCLDWSQRRHHLGGQLGAALLDRVFGLGWARREKDGRAVRFTPQGEIKFNRTFAVDRRMSVRLDS